MNQQPIGLIRKMGENNGTAVYNQQFDVVPAG
jgi:hypothetical protein